MKHYHRRKVRPFVKITLIFIVIFVFTTCVYIYATKPSDSTSNNIPIATASSQSPSPSPTSSPLITKVPVLCYHCVGDNTFGIKELFVSPSQFGEQMQLLDKYGYTPIWFNDLKNIDSIEKPIMITFDDGYENNYSEAYPILKKHGFKATIFICSNFIDGGSMLTAEKIKKMSDLVDIQDHTMSHPDLSTLSNTQIEKEFSDSKELLEEITGKPVIAIAYPSNKYNEKVINIAKKYFEYGVTTNFGFYTNNSNKYQIKRLYIPRSISITEFQVKITPDQ